MPDSNRSKAYKGFASQSFVTITYGLLGLVYFSFMSRLLTKEEFGLYAVVTALLAIIESLSEAGLGSAIIQKKDANQGFINTAFSLSVILGAIFALFAFFFAPSLSNLTIKSTDLANPIRVMSIGVFLFSLVSVVRATYMRKLNFLKYGLIQIAVYIFASALGIYLAYTHHGIYAPLIATIVNQFGLTITLYVMAKFKPKFEIITQHVKEIISYSGWLTGSVIVRVVNSQIDKLIMPRLLSVGLLGTYNRPSGFVNQLSSQFLGIFDTILFPILSGVQDDKVKVRSAYKQVFSLLIFVSMALSFFMILLSDVVIDIFLGNQWENLEELLQVISLGIIFSAYQRVADCFFRSLGYMKDYFLFRLLASIITIASVVIGCKYGIYGVAWAIISANLIDAIIRIVYLNNRIGFSTTSFLQLVLSTGIIPILAFVVAYVSKLFLGISSIICSVLFLFLLGSVAILKPRWLGDVYYSQVYTIYVGKIINRLKRERVNTEEESI